MRYFSGFIAVLLFLPFAACSPATKTLRVINTPGFTSMARRMPEEMQARGILDSSRCYQETGTFRGDSTPYGRILFARLSPSFIVDLPLVPSVMNFHLLSQGGRTQITQHGFVIHAPRYVITAKMLAVLDWEGQGAESWLVSCFVEPRAGRSYEYYVLVPQPMPARGFVRGKVAAVNECFGRSCTMFVHNSKIPAKSAPADDLRGEKTQVRESLPGLNDITAPPDKQKRGSDLHERSL